MKIKKLIASVSIITPIVFVSALAASCVNNKHEDKNIVHNSSDHGNNKKNNFTNDLNQNLTTHEFKSNLISTSQLDNIAKLINFTYENKANTYLKNILINQLKHSPIQNQDFKLEIIGLYPKQNSLQDLIIYYKLTNQKTKEIKGYYFELNGFKKPDNTIFSNQLTPELKKIIDTIQFKKTFDLAINNQQILNYENVLPSQIKNQLLMGLKVIQKEYTDKIKLSVLDVLFINEGGQINANKLGAFSLLLEVLDLKSKKTFQILIPVDKFKTNPYGADEYDLLPTQVNNGFAPTSLAQINQYNNADQQTRYLYDNENYLKSLKAYQRNVNWYQIRQDLINNKQKINEFDQKAPQVFQDSYESAARKGFTLPVYDEDGKYQGLSFNETEIGKSVSWVDAIGKDQWKINGLARTLPNDMYKQIALQTFGIQIQTPNGKPRESDIVAGTMWIMDYQKRNDNKYPTKWYFGTNLHVAEALKSTTTVFGINKIMPTVKTKTTLGLANADDNIYRFSLVSKDNQPNMDKPISNGIKTIYDGRDFLKLNPSDLLTSKLKNKYHNLQEFVDFAVFEIDFEKIKLGSVTKNFYSGSDWSVDKYNNLDPSELAKLITNDYAQKPNEQIKFLSKSYLNDYARINVPLDSKYNQAFDTNKYDELYAVGWPSSASDYFLDPIKDQKQFESRRESYSLWINSNYQFYNKLNHNPPLFPLTQINRGDFLSYNIGYRSFTNKPGLLDAFIASPITGKTIHKSTDNQNYIGFGLNYLPMHYSPIGGSSGTSLRNQKNELVGIWHVGNGFAQTGLAVAFRSEGYDYHGLYGSYNLPQYDLIYGGGKDQKTSYRQAMMALYKNKNIATALFPNGFGEDQIPSAFKFKN